MSGLSINRDENAVSLQVDTRFYGHLAVLVAAAEFAENFWIQMDGDPRGTLTLRLVPKSDDLDIEACGREFFNYMIALMDESCAVMVAERKVY